MFKKFIAKKKLLAYLRSSRNQMYDLLNRAEVFQEQTYLQGRIDAIELIIYHLTQK